MCDKEHFEGLRERVTKLEVKDAAQTEQIKTLFVATSELKDAVRTALNTVLWCLCAVLLLSVLALVRSVLDRDGFRDVASAVGKAMGGAEVVPK